MIGLFCMRDCLCFKKLAKHYEKSKQWMGHGYDKPNKTVVYYYLFIVLNRYINDLIVTIVYEDQNLPD